MNTEPNRPVSNDHTMLRVCDCVIPGPKSLTLPDDGKARNRLEIPTGERPSRIITHSIYAEMDCERCDGDGIRWATVEEYNAAGLVGADLGFLELAARVMQATRDYIDTLARYDAPVDRDAALSNVREWLKAYDEYEPPEGREARVAELEAAHKAIIKAAVEYAVSAVEDIGEPGPFGVYRNLVDAVRKYKSLLTEEAHAFVGGELSEDVEIDLAELFGGPRCGQPTTDSSSGRGRSCKLLADHDGDCSADPLAAINEFNETNRVRRKSREAIARDLLPPGHGQVQLSPDDKVMFTDRQAFNIAGRHPVDPVSQLQGIDPVLHRALMENPPVRCLQDTPTGLCNFPTGHKGPCNHMTIDDDTRERLARLGLTPGDPSIPKTPESLAAVVEGSPLADTLLEAGAIPGDGAPPIDLSEIGSIPVHLPQSPHRCQKVSFADPAYVVGKQCTLGVSHDGDCDFKHDPHRTVKPVGSAFYGAPLEAQPCKKWLNAVSGAQCVLTIDHDGPCSPVKPV